MAGFRTKLLKLTIKFFSAQILKRKDDAGKRSFVIVGTAAIGFPQIPALTLIRRYIRFSAKVSTGGITTYSANHCVIRLAFRAPLQGKLRWLHERKYLPKLKLFACGLNRVGVILRC